MQLGRTLDKVHLNDRYSTTFARFIDHKCFYVILPYPKYTSLSSILHTGKD